MSMSPNVIFQNMKLLQDEGYIEPIDSTWHIYKLSSYGNRLVEDKKRLNVKFPVNPEENDFSSTILRTLEGLISERFPEPFKQLMKAKSFLYGIENPDTENCIKESVGALEGMVRLLFGESKTLSDLLPKIKSNYLGHPAMAKIFDSIYAVRGDAPGVAHGSDKVSKLTQQMRSFYITHASFA